MLDKQYASLSCDTGASDTFATAKVLGTQAVGNPKTGAYVLCAGNQRMAILGSHNIQLRMGSYNQRICTNVVNELMEGVDLILGTSWLRANKVKIDYAKMYHM